MLDARHTLSDEVIVILCIGDLYFGTHLSKLEERIRDMAKILATIKNEWIAIRYLCKWH